MLFRYDRLTPAQKALVTNYQLLLDVELAKIVFDLIVALDWLNARIEYDALTSTQKALVTNYQLLLNTETYGVTDFALYGGFSLTQNGNPALFPVPKYLTYIKFTKSSVGGVYAYEVAFYPTSNPANKTGVFGIHPANGDGHQFSVFPLDPATDYTVSVTLINKDTLQELTNLLPVQTITFTTPN